MKYIIIDIWRLNRMYNVCKYSNRSPQNIKYNINHLNFD